MFFLTKETLFSNTNSILNVQKFFNEKTIKINGPLVYLSRLNNKIFYINNNGICKRIIVEEPLEPKFDESFKKEYSTATHNMYFFKDKDNYLKAVGGMDTSSLSEYSKGLYLFDYDEISGELICTNNNNPIITSPTKGNYDGFYGIKQDLTNIENCRNGTIKFDSFGSIIYNKQNNLYYLYHRANVTEGTRLIQYSTSSDLINWSDFNLVNFDLINDFYKKNFYYSNFFQIPNSNIYLCIIPFVNYNESAITFKKINIRGGAGKFVTLKNELHIEKYIICYSYDLINYKYIGDLFESEALTLESFQISTNLPLYYENKMYLYMVNNDKNELVIYSSKPNRYFYLTNQNDLVAEIITKVFDVVSNQIELNLTVESDGYLKCELYDENNNLIPDYGIDDFDLIKDIDSINCMLSWKGASIIPNQKVSLKIIFYKAKIYTISGNLN